MNKISIELKESIHKNDLDNTVTGKLEDPDENIVVLNHLELIDRIEQNKEFKNEQFNVFLEEIKLEKDSIDN